jgi:phosphopantetheinyl transferase
VKLRNTGANGWIITDTNTYSYSVSHFRIRIQIVLVMSGRIGMDIDITNMRFERSSTDTV